MRWAIVACLLAAAAGCWPPPFARGAAETYVVKNGHAAPVGIFGGGLIEAVHDDPAALAEAQAYRRDATASFSLGVSSLAAADGGSLVLIAGAGAEHAPGTPALRPPVIAASALLFSVGLGLAIPAVITGFRARGHLKNAIRLYNRNKADALPRCAGQRATP